MQLIQTTEQMAYNILSQGNRKIKALKNKFYYDVEWININNRTCFIIHSKNSGCTLNNEDVTFFIQVPKSAKKVY